MATYRRMLKDKDGNNIIPAGFSLPVPDYANAINFNSNTYTAPSDGYVQVRVDVTRTGSAGITILDVTINRNGQSYNVNHSGAYYDISGYNHSYIDVTVPVRAGDIITLSTNAASTSYALRAFYPILWA